MAEKSYNIDFGGVDKEIRKGSGKAAHVPEGDYLVKIVKGEIRPTKDEKSKYFSWQLQIVDPSKYKGKTVYFITSLKPDALWNLRNLIHAALGKNVAGKSVKFNPGNLEGKVVCVTLEDDEYTNSETKKTTIKSVVADVRSKTEYEAAGDEDDEDEEEETEEEDEETEDEDEDEDLEDVDVEAI